MIGETSRRLTNFQKNFINSNERCQFAVEVNNSNLIPIIIRNLEQYILGFHLKLEGENLVYHKDKIRVHEIPRTVRNTKEACNFVDSINYDFKDTFSIIAANESIVSISVSHLICDGGFFIDIFDKLLLEKPYQMTSKFPITTSDTFLHELSKVTKKDIKKHQETNNMLTSLRWSKNYEELQKKVDKNTKCNYIAYEIPAKESQFYKSKMNLTDLYMTSLSLSIMGLNGKLDSNFGISTCVDLRQFLPRGSKNPSNTQNTSEFGVVAQNVNNKMTIRDLAKLYRIDLMNKLKDGTPFAAYQSLFDDGYCYETEKTCSALLSNVGKFKCNSKNYSAVTDMWIQQTMPALGTQNVIGLLAFSKEKYGQNTLVFRLQQPSSVINNDDAELLMKSIAYMMKEVPPDISIKDAFDELRNFQIHSQK